SADAPAFGKLDMRRAIPRGRGFQLVGDVPEGVAPPIEPATYRSRVGEQQAVLLALARARFEAASDRLDAAARWGGLATRFGAADLALLAVATPTKERPALFGFLPLDERPVGEWMLEVFGDDLAWVAGVNVPEVGGDAPMARRLHAAWRKIFSGQM